jgi:hypothetical protein
VVQKVVLYGSDSRQPRQFIVGKLDFKSFLQRHHQLDTVEAISTKIIDEASSSADVLFWNIKDGTDDFHKQNR